jgi:RNA recognition motif-containing protein
MSNNRLFVGNLDFNVGEEELRGLFAPMGSLLSVSVVLERDTGMSRGFGFVEYKTDEDARAAIGTLDGSDLRGRNLRVSAAKERSGSGGSGAFTRTAHRSERP